MQHISDCIWTYIVELIYAFENFNFCAVVCFHFKMYCMCLTRSWLCYTIHVSNGEILYMIWMRKGILTCVFKDSLNWPFSRRDNKCQLIRSVRVLENTGNNNETRLLPTYQTEIGLNALFLNGILVQAYLADNRPFIRGNVLDFKSFKSIKEYTNMS